jgi:hypothetical protein
METPLDIFSNKALHQFGLMRFEIATQRFKDKLVFVSKPSLSDQSAHLLLDPRGQGCLDHSRSQASSSVSQYFRTSARYAAGWRHCNNCDSSRARRISSRSTVATA